MEDPFDIFDIIDKFQELDNLEVGSLPMSASETLYGDNRSAIIGAAAKNMGQNQKNSVDLEMLMEKFNIENDEVIDQMIIIHVNEVLR